MKSETIDHLLPLCLIIDESPIVCKLASIYLSPLGFRTAEVQNSEEGLKSCSHLRPGLILLDWHMSDMNGELFLTKLQSIFTDKLPPIIVTSVEYKASIFEHAGNLGIIGFLYKPFTKDMLVSVLDQAHLIPKKRHSRMHTSHEHKKAHPSHEHPKTS